MLDPAKLEGASLGEYRVLERLGRGGFGYVYKCQHIWFDKTFAIKVHQSIYNEKDSEAAQKVADFLHEAQTHQKLEHPFILRLHNVGRQLLAPDSQEAIFYLVMEYAPGGSLQDRLDRYPGQPLLLQEALTILGQIGQALHYAHQHLEGTIVHRDLKPANILFNAKGDPVVADFGLATELSSGQTARVGQGGTLAYMSPEQFDGEVSVKSDQYSLGCIAYELLTGQRPFAGGLYVNWYSQHKAVIPKDLTLHNAQIPAAANLAVLKALAKKREDRHDSVLQFIEAMRDVRVQKSFDEWYKEGQISYDAGNYVGALAAYQEASRLRPDFADAHFNQGVILFRLQRYELATAAFERAISCDDRQSKFYIQCGNAFSERGLFARALEMYRQALQLAPGNTRVCELLGDTYYDLKQYPNAVTAYKQALGLSAHETVKRLQASRGNRPEEARLYMNLGLALKHGQRKQEALEAFESAIVLNPNNSQAHFHKTQLLNEFRSGA